MTVIGAATEYNSDALCCAGRRLRPRKEDTALSDGVLFTHKHHNTVAKKTAFITVAKIPQNYPPRNTHNSVYY